MSLYPISGNLLDSAVNSQRFKMTERIVFTAAAGGGGGGAAGEEYGDEDEMDGAGMSDKERRRRRRSDGVLYGPAKAVERGLTATPLRQVRIAEGGAEVAVHAFASPPPTTAGSNGRRAPALPRTTVKNITDAGYISGQVVSRG
mmetsp:Transcript_8579/g.15540  ORF Transcript_8579/g.15540 Transcript_8579/m.15540 type:complete len:144 (-) Transcript_8579:496-927(-)